MRVLPFSLILMTLGCDGDAGKDSDTAAGTDSGDTDTDTDSDSDTDSDTDTDVTAVGVELTPEALTMATTRDLPPLVATGEWDDGSKSDVTAECTWTNSDPAVTWVGADGVVHGLGVGIVTVKCDWQGFSDESTVDIRAVTPAAAGDIVINELLADPAVDADVNGDGNADPTEDEFVEFVNVAAFAVDIEGATVWESNVDTERHRFGPNSVMRPGEAVVLFGGGAPLIAADRCFAYPVFNADSSLKYGLALNNEGDTVTLRGAGEFGDIASAEVDPAVEDASIVLSPDMTGSSYTHHLYATDSIGAYSPCTKVDGTSFPTASEWLGG